MGKLAAWSAVAGGAKGALENIAHEEKKEMMSLDEARSMRILQMQQQHQTEMQKSSQAHAGKMQDTQIGAQKDMQKAGFEHAEDMQGNQQEFQQGMQDDEQSWKSDENEKDRDASRDVAAIRASASGSKKGRWSFSKMKESRTVEGSAGLPGEFEVPVLRDGATGAQYIQRGDRFMLPDDNPASVKRAEAKAIAELMRNGQIDAFVEKYRYIPYAWMSRATAAEGGISTNTEDTDY